MRDYLISLPYAYKRALQVFADITLIVFSLWLAFGIRTGFEHAFLRVQYHSWLLWLVPLISLPVFVRMGMYRAVMRYLGKEALINIFKAVTISALLLALAIYLKQRPGDILLPRSFVLIYWIVSLALIGGLRLLMRQYFLGDWLTAGHAIAPFLVHGKKLPHVAVYGAGSAGNQLVSALRLGGTMEPVAFIDDNPNIVSRNIAGLRVYSPDQIEQMIQRTGATQVLLALPSVSRTRRREILSFLESYPVHVRSIPGFMDLASGKVKVQDIQEVDIADLLGRDAVAPNQALFERCIKEQVVMVTGAGGSIGSELCRQILSNNPIALILYEHSEFNLYSIQEELKRRIEHGGLSVRLIPVLGSIRNKQRVLEVMRSWRVNTLYHAAAYKHVPLVEHNNAEGVFNNVMGTVYTAQAAIIAGVQNFVLVSTDKAVRPTNVMGGTKRLAEMVLQALSQETNPRLFRHEGVESCTNNTRFTMVRFGNVLGSSGSVVPLFRQQIQNGGPVTVTHPEVTRFFMTIPEAAQLVLQAGSMGQGGDVFVLDMGKPVNILDMAEKMIRLTGLTVRSESEPNGDIEIKFTGLRSGEKLYEELLIGNNVSETEHPMIMRANEAMLPWAELCEVLERLIELAKQGDCAGIRKQLRETVDGYNPQGDIVDLVYVERVQRLN